MVTNETYRIDGDVRALLDAAPGAIDSFSPGHWALLSRLEREASAIVQRRDIDEAAAFFADVAYLKRPNTLNREEVRLAVLKYAKETLAALDALAQVRALGYEAMDVLAHVPFFGRRGGRSFNSAVLRLVCPESFSIVDWRNIAVLCGSIGFDGLVIPTMVFSQFSKDDVLVMRGHLPFTPDVYRTYNDVVRSLARSYGMRAADIDLALWTYSVQQRPFVRFSLPALNQSTVLSEEDRQSLLRDHQNVAGRLVQDYLARLREAGVLSRDQILAELHSVFALIRDECAAFGRTKKGKLKDRLMLIIRSLDDAIVSSNSGRLLEHWRRWEGMVDPSSSQWIGISLPTDMILEGYLVLEDFIPVKDYVESYYDPSTFDPRYECD